MRARLVFEKFSEDGDPITDMGIGPKYRIKQWFDSVGVKPSEYTIDNDMNITVKGSLMLQGTQITELPDNLSVGGTLYLRDTPISKLPDNLSIGGDLDLRGTPITELPDNLKVEGSLDLVGTQITKLPDNLRVGETIYKDF